MKDASADWDRDEHEALDEFAGELRALRARHAGRALPEGLDQHEPELSAQDENRLLATILKRARQQDAPAAMPRIRWRDAIAVAGLAAAIALAVRLPWRAPAPAGAPAAAVASLPAPAATAEMVLALAKPEIKLSLAALQWRGTAGDNPLITDLAPAFAAFRRDDFAEAVRRLEPLTGKHPRSVEVFFYLGVSRLLQNDGPGGRRSLQTALGVADEAFAPDVAWYLAIADERSGDRAAARARLESLCRDGGAHAADACAGAARLQ